MIEFYRFSRHIKTRVIQKSTIRGLLNLSVLSRKIPIIAILIFLVSCEKIEKDLKDPAESDKWTLYNTATGLTGNQVRGTFCDSKGDMWFAVS